MKKELDKIKISKIKVAKNIDSTLQQITDKGLRKEDLNLVEDILMDLKRCYEDKIYTFIEDVKRGSDRLDEYNQSPIPSLSDCLNKIKQKLQGGPINFFPSNNKGPCHPQCLVISSGNWEFNDTVIRNNILSYWYRCFYKNRFTLIFSESWQSTSWLKWEKLIDSYVEAQKIQVAGQSEDVNHTVIVIEYSNDMVNLRYHETSV